MEQGIHSVRLSPPNTNVLECLVSKMFVYPHSGDQIFGHLAQMKLVQMGVSPNGG